MALPAYEYYSNLGLPQSPKTTPLPEHNTYEDLWKILNAFRLLIEEIIAPIDGKYYVRRNGEWVAISPGVIPVVTGEVPPVLVYLEDGSLLYTELTT